MIKYILIFLFSTLAVNAYSQAPFSYGFKLGGGIATQKFNNKDVISINSIGTLAFSGIVGYELPHRFQLQSGLGIANKGAQIIEDGITSTPKITYLDLPLNIVKKFNFPGLGMVYIGAGGYAAKALNGKYKFETPNSVTTEKLQFGSSGDVQKFDEGLNATAGIELNNHLLFDIRYAYGLKNISTYPLRDTGTSEIYNRFLSVSLGYVFR